MLTNLLWRASTASWSNLAVRNGKGTESWREPAVISCRLNMNWITSDCVNPSIAGVVPFQRSSAECKGRMLWLDLMPCCGGDNTRRWDVGCLWVHRYSAVFEVAKASGASGSATGNIAFQSNISGFWVPEHTSWPWKGFPAVGWDNAASPGWRAEVSIPARRVE